MAEFRSYLIARLFWLLGGVFIGLSFIAFLIVSPTAQFYFTDYWEHLASIRDFRIHGLHPTNPIYALAVPAREFTPWHLALGLLSRVSGLSPEFVLGLGGVIISAVFLYGVWEFGRAYYERRGSAGNFPGGSFVLLGLSAADLDELCIHFARSCMETTIRLLLGSLCR